MNMEHFMFMYLVYQGAKNFNLMYAFKKLHRWVDESSPRENFICKEI